MEGTHNHSITNSLASKIKRKMNALINTLIRCRQHNRQNVFDMKYHLSFCTILYEKVISNAVCAKCLILFYIKSETVRRIVKPFLMQYQSNLSIYLGRNQNRDLHQVYLNSVFPRYRGVIKHNLCISPFQRH